MSRRILYSGADATLVASIRRTLEDAGFELAIDESGTPAARLVQQPAGSFCLLLLDARSGARGAAEAVRAVERAGRAIPVILVVDASSSLVAREIGAAAVLRNGFAPDELLYDVARLSGQALEAPPG